MSSCLATCHLPSSMTPSQVRFTVSQYYHYTRIANARRLLHHPSTRLRQPATCRHYTSSATPCSRASTLYTANTSYRNWHCSKWTQHGSIAVTRSFYRTSDQDNEPLPPKNDGTTPQMLQEDELLGYFARLSNPRTLVRHLDEYVIGQERAKKTLAVAVFNHYNRVRANLYRQARQQQRQEEEQQQQAAATTTMDGPGEGGGAPHHNTDPEQRPSVPWPPSNTTRLAQRVPGEMVPVERTSAYAASRRRTWTNDGLVHNTGVSSTDGVGSTATTTSTPDDNDTTTNTTGADGMIKPISSRRSSPESRILDDMEDTTVFEKSNVLLIGPTGSGKTLLAKTLAQVLQVPFSMSDAVNFTQAGYVGEDVELVIQRLLQACDHDVKRAETGIVFIDEIDKISRRTDASSSSRDVSGEGVQQSLLRMLEGTIVNVTDKSPVNSSSHNKRGGGAGGGNGLTTGTTSFGGAAQSKPEVYSVDTSNILFILSGAFIGLDRVVSDRVSKGSIGFNATIRSLDDGVSDKKNDVDPLSMVEPADLVKYGLIPEFIGRIPVVASLKSLLVEDLVRILVEPKNSLVKQYQGLFRLNNVDLHFSHAALRSIAEEALAKKTGARGLRRIMEDLLLEAMYDAPNSSIKHVIVDSKVATKEKPHIYLPASQPHLVDTILAEDDNTLLSRGDNNNADQTSTNQTEIAKLGLLQYDPSRQTENPIMSVVAFLASTVKPEVAAAAVGQVPKERTKDDKEQQEQEEIKKKEEENKEARQLTHKLFRTKLQHFQAKVAQFEKLESIVEDERRKLEKERHQMTMDRLALKSKIEQVEREMLKRGNTPNSITPAQIQQQIAGGMMPGGSNMYMNPAAAAAAAAAAHAAGGQPNAQQPHPMQMQQQQYQLQMQRQMQQGPVSQAPGQYQQQQQQQQPPSSGHNFNMMSF